MELKKKLILGCKYILLPMGILFLYQWIGNLISQNLLRFIPGPILGMILLLLSLKAGIVPYALMRPFSKLLVRHISFFLIPTSVAIISVVGTVGEYFSRILGLLLLSLAAVMLTAGFLIQGINRYYKRKNRRNRRPCKPEVPHDQP